MQRKVSINYIISEIINCSTKADVLNLLIYGIIIIVFIQLGPRTARRIFRRKKKKERESLVSDSDESFTTTTTRSKRRKQTKNFFLTRTQGLAKGTHWRL